MSLDVSPDGRTILFDLLGDLYTLPFTGGQATLVSGGMAFESEPRYSPDGGKIVFLSDCSGSENIWIMDADGRNPRPVTREGRRTFISPRWTPDGSHVLASRMDDTRYGYFHNPALRLYPTEGGAGVELAQGRTTTGPAAGEDPPGHANIGAAASPDGRWIYFSRRRNTSGNFWDNLSLLSYQIWRLNCETGAATQMTEAPGGAMAPLLSPDGKWLVYASRHETSTGLRVREMETHDERWLVYPVTRDDKEGAATRGLVPGYAFTPDGREIVTTIGGRISRVNVASGEVTNVPFTANVSLDLGPRLYTETRVEEGPVKARLIRWASQSPDGRHLAFSAFDGVYVMGLPDGRLRRLNEAEAAGEFAPAWSPDGRSIAFLTWGPEGGHVWKAPVEGGAPQQLSRRAGYYSSLAFSPDGERIVVVAGSASLAPREPTGCRAGATVAAGLGRRLALHRARGRRLAPFREGSRPGLRLEGRRWARFVSPGWNGPQDPCEGRGARNRPGGNAFPSPARNE